MLPSFSSSNITEISRANILGRVRITLTPEERLNFKTAGSQQLLRAAPNGCVLSSFPINNAEESDLVEQAVVGWLNSSAEAVLLEGSPELVVAVAERLPRTRVYYRLAPSATLSEAASLLASSTMSDVVGGFEVCLPSQNGDAEKFVRVCQDLRNAAKRASDQQHGYGHGYFVTLFVVPNTKDVASLPSSTIGRLDKMGVHMVLEQPTGLGLDSNNAPIVSSSTASTASATSTESTTASQDTISDVGLNLISCLRTDRPDGLFTTVVCDECGVALGLVYSSCESICESIKTGRGVYYSRSRKGLWRKGETSGAIQELVSIAYDCDSDALQFCVRQLGNPPSFCHTGNRSCWGPAKGLRALQQVLQSRLESAPQGSYTRRLYNDEELLRNKLLEEAQELSEAKETDHVAAEAADVIYFTMVAAVKGGASLEQIESHLDRRTLKIKRRPGNAKPERIAAAAAELGAIRQAKRQKLQ
jgi:phosphoribosyl-ATP pyrophosphohydrolase/phosphoribosyl-AMP cyclohydrolase/histidinol dehydrogenase